VELLGKDSAVNRRGLEARAVLSKWRPASYLWFWGEDQPTSCSVCGSDDLAPRGKMLLCEKCRVVL
jgi:hypothetical protein